MREYHELRQALEGDPETAAAYVGVARTQLGVLKNAMQLGGLPSGMRMLYLPDGTAIRVSSVAGQDRIEIVTPRRGQTVPAEIQTSFEPDRPPVPGVPYIGAVCDSGNPGLFVTNTVNGVSQSGGPGLAARIMAIVPCTGGLKFTVVPDPARHFANNFNPSSLTMSVQLYDLRVTTTRHPHLSIVGMDGADEYNTFDGRRYVIGWTGHIGTPYYATQNRFPILTSPTLPPPNDPYGLNDENGNPVSLVPGMRILKWKQTGGNITMLPFTIDGGKYPTLLALAGPVPLLETFTVFQAPLPGFTYWAGEAGGPLGWLFTEYQLDGGWYDFLQPTYTAQGTLVVMDLIGNVTPVPISVATRYNRSSPLIVRITNDGFVGAPTGETKDFAWAPGDSIPLPNESWFKTGTLSPVYTGPNGVIQP